METLLKDLRYGIRGLLKSPGFALIAVLSLALGIGANTAIFSLLNASLLRPLPVEDAEQLVTVYTTDAKNPGNLSLSYLNYLDYRDKNEVFSGVLGYAFAAMSLSSRGQAERIFGEVVSGNYFNVLGIKPARGRIFLPSEDQTPGAHPVAVLSYGLWQRAFGGDPDLVGQTVSLNRHEFTVIGIAPADFAGVALGGKSDVWVPTMMHNEIQPGFTWYDSRRGLFMNVIGRLKPDTTLEQARASVATLARQLEQEYPNDNEGRSVKLVPMLEARLNPDGSGQMMLISGMLMAVVGIVLLIACANVANLLLARASVRQKEIAIRLAMGASRRRLIRQLLTESILLSLLGGAVGLMVAFWTKELFRSLGPFGAQSPADSNLNPRVLGFTFILSVLSGIVFGLAPALQASRADLVPSLKRGVTPQARSGLRLDLRKVLVVIQVALSLMSLICAGLLLRSLQKSKAVDPGFPTENVLLAGLDLGLEGFAEPQGRVLYQRLMEQVGTLPGVESAALARNRPFSAGGQSSVFIEGQESSAGGKGVLVQTNAVGLNFFETLSIPLVKGRGFSELDTEKSPKVVIINEAMAGRFWPGQQAVGRRLKLFGDESYREVVGVAKDVKYVNLVEDNRLFMYLPLAQNYASEVTLHVRTVNQPSSVVAALRDEVRGLDTSLPVFSIQTVNDRIDRSLASQQTWATLSAFFGGLALLLAAVGLYGVMFYSVSQRTRELGIRMALGARKRDVVKLVLRQAVGLVAVGVLAGLVAAFALSRVLTGLLFGVSAVDPVTFGGAAFILVAVALVAGYVPALRAAKVDPIVVLRYE